MTEISDFAGILLVITAGFSFAVFATKATERIPIPAPALFLVAAAAFSDLWRHVEEVVQVQTVERVAVVALVVILFNGGIDIGWRRFRTSAKPILSLGLLGTFATAGLAALLSHYLLGLSWTVAGILGAAVAPTDPAVMFSVLRKRELGGRSGTILEGEAGINDPAGIALMLGMIELATHEDASSFVVIREFVVQMSVGTVLGALGGVVLIWTLRRIALASEGLYPVLALVLAGALYALTSLAHGSGFLAVFIAGLLLGNARTPYKGEIERFSSSLATFAELGVFVALGLTIELGGISARTWVEGVMLAVLVALVVRPLVVLLTLVGARLSRAERAFIAWSGLKGAVPILLAAFALLSGVEEASRVYSLVFVVVLVSVVGQGTLLPHMARVLRIPIRETASLPWEFSIRLEEEPDDAHEFEIGPASRARGRPIRELPLGTRSWVTLVVRNGAATRPTGALVLEAGDRVLVLSDPNDVEPLRKLFRGD